MSIVPMRKEIIWILLFVCILSSGAFFRLWRLNDRPMHTDEAVHAEKFGMLLEKDQYRYDPHEFHGPTLNYFTLASAWVCGEKTYTEINEATLRAIPAVFGVGLILMPLFFLQGMGRRAVFFSGVLIAFSPAFIYYSRYYIQEMLLVFFTAAFLGCGWKYFQTRKSIWIILSGVSIGLMHATKETFVLSILAALLALVFCRLFEKPDRSINGLHLMAGVVAMVVTSVLFYSSFGTNPQGIIDSVATYGVWLQRAGGQSVHVHPWYYYLNLLIWVEFIQPFLWNEDGLVAFAAIGLVFVFLRKGDWWSPLVRFLGVYTFVLVVIYSVIPYKTPWSMMSFVYGMALLAGFTADRFLQVVQGRVVSVVVWILVLICGLASPLVQGWMLNFCYFSDPMNPYVYAHTSADIYPMVEAVQKAAAASGDGNEMPIQVIAADGDYWPMPWYLRFNTNVGYWSEVDDSVHRVSVILANVKHEQELLKALYLIPEAGHRNLYVPLFDMSLELRPGVAWRGYVRKDLWDRMNMDMTPIPK